MKNDWLEPKDYWTEQAAIEGDRPQNIIINQLAAALRFHIESKVYMPHQFISNKLIKRYFSCEREISDELLMQHSMFTIYEPATNGSGEECDGFKFILIAWSE